VAETAKKLAQIQEQFSITDDFVYLLGEDEFVMPGFIDTHIHAPQFPNAGLGYDKELLDWLTTYTFPLEMKYSDLNFATKVYEAVVVSNLDSNEVTLSSK
jgi:guanine deaminase